jgi:hypothetical protein
MSRFRGISARISQWIVRAAPVGYEEFYVLLERGLFNPAPVEHTHIFDGTERWVWPPVSTGRLNRDTTGGTFNAIWTDADHQLLRSVAVLRDVRNVAAARQRVLREVSPERQKRSPKKLAVAAVKPRLFPAAKRPSISGRFL